MLHGVWSRCGVSGGGIKCCMVCGVSVGVKCWYVVGMEDVLVWRENIILYFKF